MSSIVNSQNGQQIKVACCQFEPRIGEKDFNINLSLEYISKAASNGAQLIVLPELCNTGYVFKNRDEALSLSEEIPSGKSVVSWEKVARDNNVYIAAGICEREDVTLYNSAVLIGPDGYIGTFRKIHLWNEEKLIFNPGNLGVPVFETEIGKIGMLICYDIWFPEAHRQCSLQDADIICVPTNWVPMPEQAPNVPPMAVHICMTNAHVNGIFIAAADRIGIERNQPFLGNSIIVGPKGWAVSGPASADKEEIIMATCDFSKVRDSKSLNKFNHVLNDRRVEAYQKK
jgi:N-carbamoylputrescine amidase